MWSPARIEQLDNGMPNGAECRVNIGRVCDRRFWGSHGRGAEKSVVVVCIRCLKMWELHHGMWRVLAEGT